ncbi:hypothetical protein A2U01_0071219, partial [Trifolium medium]|nr:hypothetical protein [Trifolium medium]
NNETGIVEPNGTRNTNGQGNSDRGNNGNRRRGGIHQTHVPVATRVARTTPTKMNEEGDQPSSGTDPIHSGETSQVRNV